MIIYTQNNAKVCVSCSIAPNYDWTGKAEFIIDETDPTKVELVEKIKAFAPHFDYVLNEDGEPIDVVQTGEVEEIEPEATADELINILLGVE